MQMERSVSCAERSTPYGGAAAAGVDLRSYSASYAPRGPPSKVSRARSTSAWPRPAPVQRSGSVKSVSGAPRLNLRSYSASYAASYAPTYDGAGAEAAAGGGGQLKRVGSTTAAPTWTSSGRRSVNLRGYTPSFAALDDTAAAPAAVPGKKAAAIDDAELRRKKRLVVYKVYGVEGKVRDSLRRSVSWIKTKCSRVVYGWW
ncbi:hypothetical protein ACP70R_029871 [Stipagrostis hirtigluma subsp. patula]